jgi:carbonic anhydrase
MTTVAFAVLSTATLFTGPLFAADPPANCAVKFGYSPGYGQPSEWGRITGFELCGKGETQSPVVLKPTSTQPGEALRFQYEKTKVKLKNSGYDFRAEMPADAENLLFLPDGPAVGYPLANFHFHRLSEHQVIRNGQPQGFAGEIHLVHQLGDQIVAVGIFVKQGAHNQGLDELLGKLPLELCESIPLEIDPTVLLRTAKGSYYKYTGSLTTPACTQGVWFFIYPNPIEMDAGQLRKLETYGRNARPIQHNPKPLPVEYVKVAAKK